MLVELAEMCSFLKRFLLVWQNFGSQLPQISWGIFTPFLHRLISFITTFIYDKKCHLYIAASVDKVINDQKLCAFFFRRPWAKVHVMSAAHLVFYRFPPMMASVNGDIYKRHARREFFTSTRMYRCYRFFTMQHGKFMTCELVSSCYRLPLFDI